MILRYQTISSGDEDLNVDCELKELLFMKILFLCFFYEYVIENNYLFKVNSDP